MKKKDLVSSLLQHCHEDNYVNFLNLYTHVGIEQLTDEPSKKFRQYTPAGEKKINEKKTLKSKNSFLQILPTVLTNYANRVNISRIIFYWY